MNVSCKRAVDHNPIKQNGVELITVDLITVGQNLVDFFPVELNTECQFSIRSKYCRHRSRRTNSYLCRTKSKRSCRPKSVEHLMRPHLLPTRMGNIPNLSQHTIVANLTLPPVDRSLGQIRKARKGGRGGEACGVMRQDATPRNSRSTAHF